MGMNFKVLKLLQHQFRSVFITDYKDNGNREILFLLRHLQIRNFKHLKRMTRIITYSMQETEYYIMSNIDRKNIIWHTENFECIITGEFSQEEVKRIINSIYERNST